MANPYEYIVFEADQVLTNDHLNETFNYLDQQNRWTRNKLIGIGIVCGLNIVQHPGVIEITKGCGVTSQGYLILQDTTQYAYYIPYAAPDQPNDLPFTYPGDLPFYKPYCANKNIFLLLTDDQYNALETNDQKNALTLSSAQKGFLENYVVVLFLEAREIDLKNCDMFDCNNKGERMMFAVKPLLVAKRNLPGAQVVRGEGTSATGLLPYLPHEIEFKRFNVPYTPLKTTDDIINAFSKLVDDFTLSHVTNAYIYSYEKYKLLLNETVNPFTGMYNQLRNGRDLILKNLPVFIQYFYDFIDDLIKAYYEFATKISGIISSCCPDENLFPLHLVLGEASRNTDAFVHDAYRRYFIYSPLFAKAGGETTEAVFLFQRMKLIVKEFAVPFQRSLSGTSIKITPSQYEYPWLSQRAIPYYYTVNETGNELYKNWNYYKTSHGNAAFNLGYNANLYNTNIAVTQPLLFDIEHYNFFRIEGHIGHNYKQALFNVLEQRLKFNLPFDVVAIAADQLPLDDTNLPQCNIQDLNTDYKLIVSEFACKVHTAFCFVSKFPYPPQDFKTTAGTAGTQLNSFSAFRAEAVHNISASLLLLQVAYSKGDFMRRYCPPAAGTIGSFYLDLLSKSGFSNPMQPSGSQNATLILYYYIFEFIDSVEEVMMTLATSSIATLDMTVLKTKYARCRQNATLLGFFIAEWLESLMNDSTAEWLKDLELNLLMEEFTVITYSCLDECLQTLKDEYIRRVQLYELQKSFLYYYSNHLGLEHKAGVPKGGTFVLVYHTLPQRTAATGTFTTGAATTINSAAFENNNTVQVSPEINQSAIDLIRSFVDDCKDAPPEKKKTIIDILTHVGEAAQPRFEIEHGAVIADFYVPYLCCSDCAPVAYILPKEDTQPDKPVIQMETGFCDNDRTAHTIKVSPPGGTFADANGNKINGLDETNSTFIPAAAGSGSYTIIYTVNNIASDPVTVTVLRTPKTSDFKFEFKETDKFVFEVTFIPAEQDSNFSYKWSFGDGFEPQSSSDEIATVKATVSVTGGETKTFVSLVVSNGNCSADEVKKEFLISPKGVFEEGNTNFTKAGTNNTSPSNLSDPREKIQPRVKTKSAKGNKK